MHICVDLEKWQRLNAVAHLSALALGDLHQYLHLLKQLVDSGHVSQLVLYQSTANYQQLLEQLLALGIVQVQKIDPDSARLTGDNSNEQSVSTEEPTDGDNS